MSDSSKICHWCHGTRVVVDGGSTFPCHVCKPPPAELSQVEAVIYGTAYALELDRRLREAWQHSATSPEEGSRELEIAEREAAQYAITRAAGAVILFRRGEAEVNAVWDGTETGRLYTAARTQKR